MADININFGRPKPRRRRRRVAGGLMGLIALAIAAFFAWSKSEKTRATPPERLPSASFAIEHLKTHDIGKGLESIPATVIEQGIFRRIPYLSWRANDVEANVYGDPDAPAGIEIGLYGNPSNRRACRTALMTLIPNSLVKAALDLTEEGKKKTLGEITVEVTPETAPDAYGAWWVSVYLPKELEAVRASDGELKDVSQPRPADAKRSRPGKDVYANDVVRQANRWLRKAVR